jgi:hypothetical protein
MSVSVIVVVFPVSELARNYLARHFLFPLAVARARELALFFDAGLLGSYAPGLSNRRNIARKCFCVVASDAKYPNVVCISWSPKVVGVPMIVVKFPRRKYCSAALTPAAAPGERFELCPFAELMPLHP